MEICGDAASDAAREDGGGRPGGATRPGGTTGERPGGTAGRPGGAAGTSRCVGGGDLGDTTSGAADPVSESTATEDVGDRGAGGGGGGGAGSFPFAVLDVAGVIGRLGRDDGVAGRDDACEALLAATFFRTSAMAAARGVVVEPDRCCRDDDDIEDVVPVRRVCLAPWFTAFVLLCNAVLARVVLLLLAHEAARGRPDARVRVYLVTVSLQILTFCFLGLLHRCRTARLSVLHGVFAEVYLASNASHDSKRTYRVVRSSFVKQSFSSPHS